MIFESLYYCKNCIKVLKFFYINKYEKNNILKNLEDFIFKLNQRIEKKIYN
jgi:hypothetical protein